VPSAFKQKVLLSRVLSMPALPRHVHQFGFTLLIRVDYSLTTLFALVHPEAWTTAGQCIGVAEDAAGGVHGIARCSGVAPARLTRTRMPSRITRPKLRSRRWLGRGLINTQPNAD
jgi:hypothetical protein